MLPCMCVPDFHCPWARNWNFASCGWPATTPMVASSAGVFTPLLELNSQAFLAALLVVGGYQALSPAIAMPPGDLIQFFFLANVFFAPIQILGNQYNQALTAMAGAERVFRLLDTTPEWTDAADAQQKMLSNDVFGKILLTP